jgi:hypothetical protein
MVSITPYPASRHSVLTTLVRRDDREADNKDCRQVASVYPNQGRPSLGKSLYISQINTWLDA